MAYGDFAGSTEFLLCFRVVAARIGAAAGQEAEPLFAALTKAATLCLGEFNPQELANIGLRAELAKGSDASEFN